MFSCFLAPVFLFAAAAQPPAAVRTWTDATGQFTTEAALVDFDSHHVVLKKHSGALVAVPIDKLSKSDQEYLRSKAASEAAEQHAAGNRTWTLRNGDQFVGHVLKYGRAKVVVRRQLGRILVNDVPFERLSKPHQYILFKVVEHFENVPIQDYKALEAWAVKQRAEAREFDCEGVLMQVDNGEQVALPFFLFSAKDEQFLRPGWEDWLAAEAKAEAASQEELAKKQQAELFLRARARDYQRDQAMQRMVELTAVSAGLVNEWQVLLVPGAGVAGGPVQAVVQARDSQSARIAAMQRYPGYVATQVVRINRRWWR